MNAAFVLRFLAPYRCSYIAIAALLLAGTALSLVPLLALRTVIDAIPRHDFGSIACSLAAAVLSVLAGVRLSVCEARKTATAAYSVSRDVRVALLAHSLHLPTEYFATHSTGEITNRVSHDVDRLAAVLTGSLVSVTGNVLIVVSFLATAAALDWRLALVAVVALPVMLLSVMPFVRPSYDAQLAVSGAVDRLMSVAAETLSYTGVVLMRTHAAERYELARYGRANVAVTRARLKFVVVGQTMAAVLTATIALGPAVLWLVGSYLVGSGSLTVGELVVAAALLARLYGPASGLATAPSEIASAAAVIGRITDYLRLPAESRTVGERQLLRGEVTFDRVSCAYANGRAGLHDVSFSVRPGGFLGIVGASGAGKSTVANLILRLLTPSSGAVAFDGRDAAELSTEHVRDQIGYVSQDTVLFHDTVAENLRFARLDAGDAELTHVLAGVGLGRWLRNLPYGLQTVVGERGLAVSGGDRQRIALARAALKRPRILVLDEPTSALDAGAEHEFTGASAALSCGATRIVISHRLSLVRDADEILVLRAGEVAERGTHADLVSGSGLYSALYRSQLRSDQPGPPPVSASPSVP